MEWFRLYSEFATDPKVQMMPEAMQRRLIMLFCLQCSNGIETFHETERETAIAFAMRISETELAETKELFLRRGFINDDWTLANWDKRQYVSDSSTARVRKHRAAKKQAEKQGETLPKRSSNALEQNRTEQSKEVKDLSVSTDDETKKCSPPRSPAPSPEFMRFWRAWPNTARKADRKKCWDKWRAKRYDDIADQIVDHVELCKKVNEQWKSGFEPAPLTYINGERWNDGVIPTQPQQRARELVL